MMIAIFKFRLHLSLHQKEKKMINMDDIYKIYHHLLFDLHNRDIFFFFHKSLAECNNLRAFHDNTLLPENFCYALFRVLSS